MYKVSTISYSGLNYTNKCISSSNSSGDIKCLKCSTSLCLRNNERRGTNAGADPRHGSRICFDSRFLWGFSDFAGGVAHSPINSCACRFGLELLRIFVDSVGLPSPSTVSPAFTSSTRVEISPNALIDDAGVKNTFSSDCSVLRFRLYRRCCMKLSCVAWN